MKNLLTLPMAALLAGAFSVAQAATCTEQSFGAITIKPSSKDNSKCVATIDATGDHRNDAISIPNTIIVDTVFYRRSKAQFLVNQTIVLPFDAPAGCYTGANLKEITKIAFSNSRWTAFANNVSEIKANKPYLFDFTTIKSDDTGEIKFSGKNCTFNFNSSNIVESSYPSESETFKGSWTFKGTYEKIEFDDNTKKGVYGFASKTEGKFSIGQFVKAGTGASVPPMRAYLVYNSQGNSQGNSPKVTAKARAISSAEEIDESVLLPENIDIVMMSAEDPEGEAPATEECFQDGDGIFEVKTIDGKKVACIDGKSDARLQTLSIPEDVTVDSIAYNREFKLGTMSTIMLPFDVRRGCSENANFYEIAYIKNVRTDLPQGSWEIYLGNPQQWAEEGILANKPYIIKAENASIKFNTSAWGNPCNYVLNTSTGSTKTSFTANFENSDSGLPGTWDFTGTYEKISFDENTKKGVYGFAANSQGDKITAGQFIKVGTGATVPPMRAYLKYNAAGVLAKAAAGAEIAEENLPETIIVKFIDGDGSTLSIGQMNTITGEITMDENKWFDMKGRVLNKKPTTKGTYYNKGQKVIIK